MNTTKAKILCVDDEAVNLKLFDAFLLPQGYDVLHASSGAQALAVIREQKVDLVLLDVMMPEMNGYDVCRRIKADRERGNIPVVMITSLDQHQERTKGIEAGAEDFISKPVDQGEVLARIRMLLRMRELNERLGRAYASITGLAAFGAQALKSFEPQEFELMPHIDLMVGQIIQQSGETIDRPQALVVSVRSAGAWKWFYYEAPFRELSRREFDLDIQGSLLIPARGDATFFYAGRSDFAAKGLADLVKRMEAHPLLPANLSNLFCFLSAELCLFAANYGRDVGAHEAAVLNTLVTQSLFFKLLADQVGQAGVDASQTVDTLLRIAAFHDNEQGLHNQRVGEYSALLAHRLGLGERFANAIRLQAQLHDVGNIGVPLGILKKEGSPDFREWEIIRAHTRLGAEIIGAHPRLAMARVIALSHHENWDGSGYPNWLQGEQIPLAGRIVALADRYDALRSERPYKPAMNHEAACEQICHGSDRVKAEHFDPAVLEAFQELAPRFAEVFASLQEPSCERRAG
jgi:response regulator RpfG family c-di-GMP phosphodiesterase